jgi:hypothetical protein
MQSKSFWLRTSAARQPILALMLVACIGACGKSAEQPNVDPLFSHPVTVSGVSSGAYMAVQTHVALSDRIAGVGVVAGGPYHCAAGSVSNALDRCMSGDGLDTRALVSYARETSAAGKIAATDNLQSSRVWIFRSPKDIIVGQKVAASLRDFYREFISAQNIRFVDDIEAAHGWPTIEAGGGCLELGGDFINACNFDTAGALLNFLYDDLGPRNADLHDGAAMSINLSGYFETGSGVADTGYVYVPNACRQSDADCRLHISFHGCRQGAEFVDDRFVVKAGLNEWAAQNRIVIVYPQIMSSAMNPQGCWDWWGYTGPQYDQKGGKQISGINALITAFAKQQLYQSSAE